MKKVPSCFEKSFVHFIHSYVFFFFSLIIELKLFITSFIFFVTEYQLYR